MTHTTLGFTTRESGLSMYPVKAFNMARYVDDRQENITHHQTILANMIGFPVMNGFFRYKHMRIKLLR